VASALRALVGAVQVDLGPTTHALRPVSGHTLCGQGRCRSSSAAWLMRSHGAVSISGRTAKSERDEPCLRPANVLGLAPRLTGRATTASSSSKGAGSFRKVCRVAAAASKPSVQDVPVGLGARDRGGHAGAVKWSRTTTGVQSGVQIARNREQLRTTQRRDAEPKRAQLNRNPPAGGRAVAGSNPVSPITAKGLQKRAFRLSGACCLQSRRGANPAATHTAGRNGVVCGAPARRRWREPVGRDQRQAPPAHVAGRERSCRWVTRSAGGAARRCPAAFPWSG
jgi:hypothetical protein